MQCKSCGTENQSNSGPCVLCGVELAPAPATRTPNVIPQEYAPPPQYIVPTSKSKVTAGILAILLGGLGAHKFYLGNIGVGVLYLVFCWTYIPAIIGLVEGIMYLSMTDQDFAQKYH